MDITKQITFLKEHYPTKGKMWCAEKLGRSEAFVRNKCADLGLRIDRTSQFFIDFQKRAALGKVGKKRPEHSLLMKRYAKEGRLTTLLETPTPERRLEMSIERKEWLKVNPHPKGFSGHNHTEEAKKVISSSSIATWKDPNSKVNSDEYRQKKSDNMTFRHSTMPAENQYSNRIKGWFMHEGKAICMRSSWELNYAHYLNFLVKQGQIVRWEYETDTFWFDKIKRGVRSYKPDFKVFLKNDSFEYHEVKGWMDPKSKTKLSRMRIYHPAVPIKLIDQKVYNSIKKNSALFPGWGTWLTEKPAA